MEGRERGGGGGGGGRGGGGGEGGGGGRGRGCSDILRLHVRVRDTALCCSVAPALQPIKIRLSQGSGIGAAASETTVYAL